MCERNNGSACAEDCLLGTLEPVRSCSTFPVPLAGVRGHVSKVAAVNSPVDDWLVLP